MRKVKKNILGRGTLLIATAILAWNCQKEETSIPQEDTAQTEQGIHRTTFWELPSHIRDQVSRSSGAAQGKSPSGKGGEPFGEVVEDQVDVLETPDGTTSYTLGMEKLADGTYMDNLVVTEAMDGAIDTHILRYRPSDDWVADRASGDVGWDAYSGEIIIFDGEGNPKAAGVFSNGRVTGQATGKGTAAKEDVMDCVVTDVSYGGLEQDGEFHVTDIIIDYECSGGGGDGLEPGPDLPNGGGQFPQGGGQPQGGGGGPQGGGGQVPTVVNEALVFEKIDVDVSVDPCVAGIITKLALKDMQRLTVPDIGQLDGTGHLSQGILDLFDSAGNYNLTFKVEQLGINGDGAELNGETTPVLGGWKIKLDSDLVNNGTQLSIAKTIIHEAVHAYLGYQLANYNPLNSDIVADLNSLYQKFKNENNSLNLTQHEFMSQYVEALAYSLAVWDNHRLPMDYYKMLSWGGLESSSAYQALNNKANIQNVIQNERFNKVGAKSTKCP